MWEEGTLPDDMEHMVTFMKHTGNWKCLRCVFEVPYNPSWGVMSGAIVAHYKEQHPDAMPNAPAPQGRCADHCVGEACPETDCPDKPVEQGAIAWIRAASKFGVRFIDGGETWIDDSGSGPVVKNIEMQFNSLSSPVPEPVEQGLPPLDAECEKITSRELSMISLERALRQCRERQLIAALREIQQLRQRCEELAEKYKEVAELQLADEASVKNLQQQLAQKEQP